MMAAENAKAEASLKALATAHGVGAAAASKQVAAIEEIGFEFTEAAHAVQPERCDSPFRYSFSMTGYSCERANARDRLCGSTVVGAAFWIEPGMGLRGQQTGTHLERGHLPPPRIRRRYGRAVAPVYSRKRSIYFGVTVSCLRSFTLT